MSDILWINGVDAADLGLSSRTLADWWSAARTARSSAQIYGAMGEVASVAGRWQPRKIPLELKLDATRTTRVGLMDDVVRATRGLCEIKVGDDTDRVAYGMVEGITASGISPEMEWYHGTLRLGPEIVCYDPIKYDRVPSVLGFGSSAVSVDMGTAPVGGVYMIHGEATTPTLSVKRDGVGSAISSMTFATLASDEALEIDMGLQTITFYDGGVASNGLSKRTAGRFFTLDPLDLPTVQVSAGYGVLYYRRRWLS